MKNQNDIFERIEAYLDGQLPAAKKREFEQEMKSDPDFAEEVRLQQDTRQLLNLHKQFAYKEKLQVLDARIEAASKKKSTIVRPVWQANWFKAVAAVVLILVAAYFFALDNTSPGQLAEESFSPYRDLITYKGENDNQDSLMEQAMYAYNLKNYPSAITLFNQVLSARPDSPDAQFYLANALLADHQPALAIPILEEVSSSAKYKEAGPWYLALAYLGDAQIQLAKDKLNQIIETSGHSYADRAKELLEKIE